MTDRDLAARDRAEAGVATPEGRAAAPSEDGERVAQPSDYDLGSTPDRTRDGLAPPVADEGTGPVAGDHTAPVADERRAPVADEPTVPPVADEPAEIVVRPRTSGAAVFGALLATVGLCGALTGLLAPEGFVVAIIGGQIGRAHV